MTSTSKVQLLVSSQTTSITSLFSAHYGVATFNIGELVAQHGPNCECVCLCVWGCMYMAMVFLYDDLLVCLLVCFLSVCNRST